MNPTMRLQILKSQLIIKNFVQGEPDCNCEIYLRELINQSKWFQEKFSCVFSPPASESHGEYDAVGTTYSLDFKLFESKTKLQAKSILFPQIKTNGACTTWYVSKVTDGKIQASNLHVLFRHASLNELEEIFENHSKKQGLENDTYEALDTLRTEKNILLFFPYQFSFGENISTDEALSSIAEGLNQDFSSAFSYRQKYAGQWDTYFTCIYNSRFLLFVLDKNQLHLIDSIACDEIPTYNKLVKSYVDYF